MEAPSCQPRSGELPSNSFSPQSRSNFPQIDDLQLNILRALRDNPGSTPCFLELYLGIPRRTLNEKISGLIALGLCTRAGKAGKCSFCRDSVCIKPGSEGRKCSCPWIIVEITRAGRELLEREGYKQRSPSHETYLRDFSHLGIKKKHERRSAFLLRIREIMESIRRMANQPEYGEDLVLKIKLLEQELLGIKIWMEDIFQSSSPGPPRERAQRSESGLVKIYSMVIQGLRIIERILPRLVQALERFQEMRNQTEIRDGDQRKRYLHALSRMKRKIANILSELLGWMREWEENVKIDA